MKFYRFIGWRSPPPSLHWTSACRPLRTGPQPRPPTGRRHSTALHFRQIGPASMSGRIADLAVYEANPSLYYVATAHGGVWKTTNNGTTFEASSRTRD